MDINAALDYVNGLHGKPNWNISASPVASMSAVWGRWDETTFITVEFVFTVPNSNHDLALRGYPVMIDAFASLEINTADVSNIEGLHELIMAKIIEIELHEWREFFREGADMAAPFHPHRPEGNAAWRESEPAVMTTVAGYARAR